VIMSLGDSLTAGVGLHGLPLEYRGLVYAIGGDEYESEFGFAKALTFPNFLKNYNPNIQGAAQSWTWPHISPWKTGQWLDAAVSHASVQDCHSQVDYLVYNIKTNYPTVDFQNDWKLLTLFIGANNLCGACEGRAESKPEYFGAQLRQVLTQIEQKIPRVFVNLVTIFNISGVYYAGQDYTYCEIIWHTIKHECTCVETGKKSDLQIMDDYAVAYNIISRNLATEFAGHNNPGFTVVVQPGLSGIEIQKFGEAYLSNLDCFHPSLCANQAFTYQIWNNMMTPEGEKLTTPDLKNLKIKCPTSTSYVQ